MTLLERFDEFGYHQFAKEPSDTIVTDNEIRRALAIAQAVDETYPDMRDSLLRRADELLEGKK